jgi:hypothetical protein
MHAFQSSMPRIKDRIKHKERGERKVIVAWRRLSICWWLSYFSLLNVLLLVRRSCIVVDLLLILWKYLLS